jgi:hypothetical protein
MKHKCYNDEHVRSFTEYLDVKDKEAWANMRAVIHQRELDMQQHRS